MFTFGTFKLALIAACAIAAAVIVVAIKRGCDGPPAPHTEVDGPYDVVSVESGASLTYTTGRRDRQRERNKTALVLWGIAAPAEGQPGCDASRAALATSAGATITIQREGRRRNATEKEVYGQSGQCLQVEQLRAGWAWCAGDAPKEWERLQQEARKARKGVWAPREVACSDCKGTGRWPLRECLWCDGTGKNKSTAKPCALCGGTGTLAECQCGMCQGSGVLIEEFYPPDVEGGL